MADAIASTDFAKLELRVAKVLEARPHPNADRLLLLQVDVGDQQKQIVAGIRHHYEPEQLVGKLIVIVRFPVINTSSLRSAQLFAHSERS
jgi:methionine--tRNA ligase beta chain